ncbi:MAG: NAD(+) diphosphatase [Pseudomonadota bacterium]
MRDAEDVTFGGSGLDRAAELRGQPDVLAQLAAGAGARILPLWRGKPLLRNSDTADPAAEAQGMCALAPLSPGADLLAHASEAPVFLGRDGEAAWFAVDVSSWEPMEGGAPYGAFLDPTEQHPPGLPQDHRFVELRAAMTRLTARDAELAAMAKGVVGWHATHRFCARCGAPSDLAEAGWQRVCPSCGARHFPRTDPVVIMLITRGNSLLIGRSPGWPEGMYSLLAGFVEPGETIEAAVRREVAEEAGIRVGAVGYLASQPWPFPASLMLGCRGEALSEAITLDPNELEDAIWITREEMLAVFAGESTRVKPARRGAIAHFLIMRWLEDTLD